MDTTIDSQTSTAKPLIVVVGLDFSDADGPAFDQAARIAQRARRSAMHLIHVFEEEPARERASELAGHLRAHVNEKAPLLGGLAGITVGIHLRAGNIVRQIAQLVVEVDADLVVVGSHRGTHLKHWLVGSNARRLIGACPCPVLVASPWPKDPAQPQEPVIEPPCPECIRTRAGSGGSKWWCEQHSRHGRGAHTYSYQRDVPFAEHDSEVIPTGIDF